MLKGLECANMTFAPAASEEPRDATHFRKICGDVAKDAACCTFPIVSKNLSVK